MKKLRAFYNFPLKKPRFFSIFFWCLTIFRIIIIDIIDINYPKWYTDSIIFIFSINNIGENI